MSSAPVRRCAAVVEYDGRDFTGWQRQRGRRSVQGSLEEALETLTGHAGTVTGAGRTDAGVHATGQVAHFDTTWERSIETLWRALNASLDYDLAVRNMQEVAQTFHARYCALEREYIYRLYTGQVRSPVRRWRTWHVRGVDVTAMAAGMRHLVGSHDFGAFGRPAVAGGSCVREMYAADLVETPGGVVLRFVANGFLRHQVRRMVGVLVDVGRQRSPPDAVPEMLAGNWQGPPPKRAPAHALVLTGVKYPCVSLDATGTVAIDES